MSDLHILLTNDDGIAAKGLATLRDALESQGHRVSVIAPNRNRGGEGHAVTFRDNLHVERIDSLGGFTCDGTAADCVRIGVLSGVIPMVDVVFSGINAGVNLGDDIHYSGTVSAAIEAAMLGVPGIAVSQQPHEGGTPFLTDSDYSYPLASAAAALARPAAEQLSGERVLLNVNLPHRLGKEPWVQMTSLGRREWSSVRMNVRPVDGSPGRLTINPWSEPETVYEAGSDFTAIRSGAVSLSVLAVDQGIRPVPLSERAEISLQEAMLAALPEPVPNSRAAQAEALP